jgi:hypothetical protein
MRKETELTLLPGLGEWPDGAYQRLLADLGAAEPTPWLNLRKCCIEAKKARWRDRFAKFVTMLFFILLLVAMHLVEG